MRKIFLLILLSLYMAETVYGEKLSDFLVTYMIRQGKAETIIIKNYCQSGVKYRIEYELESIHRIVQIVDGKTSNKEIINKYLWAQIIRLDKQVSWVINYGSKTYQEKPIFFDDLGRNPDHYNKYRESLYKIGEGKVLNFDCDIYTLLGSKLWISKSSGLLLKRENQYGNNIFQKEATEVFFNKLDDTLFEIPEGFTKEN